MLQGELDKKDKLEVKDGTYKVTFLFKELGYGVKSFKLGNSLDALNVAKLVNVGDKDEDGNYNLRLASVTLDNLIGDKIGEVSIDVKLAHMKETKNFFVVFDNDIQKGFDGFENYKGEIKEDSDSKAEEDKDKTPDESVDKDAGKNHDKGKVEEGNLDNQGKDENIDSSKVNKDEAQKDSSKSKSESNIREQKKDETDKSDKKVIEKKAINKEKASKVENIVNTSNLKKVKTDKNNFPNTGDEKSLGLMILLLLSSLTSVYYINIKRDNPKMIISYHFGIVTLSKIPFK